MKKKLFSLVIVLSVLFVSCKKKKTNAEKIIGQWEYVRFDKTSTDPYTTVDEVNKSNQFHIVEFDNEGNFTVFRKLVYGKERVRYGRYSFTKDGTKIITIHTSDEGQKSDTAEIASLTEKLLRIYNPKKDILLYQRIVEQ